MLSSAARCFMAEIAALARASNFLASGGLGGFAAWMDCWGAVRLTAIKSAVARRRVLIPSFQIGSIWALWRDARYGSRRIQGLGRVCISDFGSGDGWGHSVSAEFFTGP